MAEPTRLERLQIDRDHLEAAIADADAGKLPALIKEHRAVLAEIEKLAATPKGGSVIDQIAEKRRQREAGAAGSTAAEVRQ